MGKHKSTKSSEKVFENQSESTALNDEIKKFLADLLKSSKVHGKQTKHHHTSDIVAIVTLVLAICLLLAFVVIIGLMWT